MNELLALVLLVLGLVGLGILRKYLRNRERLRVFEMMHRERLAAIEKGLRPADLPTEGNTSAWLDEAWTERVLEAGWDRRIALAIGLVVLLGGLGAALGIYLLEPSIPDLRDARAGVSLTLIPIMAAIGLLVYHWMTRPAAGK